MNCIGIYKAWKAMKLIAQVVTICGYTIMAIALGGATTLPSHADREVMLLQRACPNANEIRVIRSARTLPLKIGVLRASPAGEIKWLYTVRAELRSQAGDASLTLWSCVFRDIVTHEASVVQPLDAALERGQAVVVVAEGCLIRVHRTGLQDEQQTGTVDLPSDWNLDADMGDHINGEVTAVLSMTPAGRWRVSVTQREPDHAKRTTLFEQVADHWEFTCIEAAGTVPDDAK